MSLIDEVEASLDNSARRAAPTDWLAPFREELAGYVEEMKGLYLMPSDEAMAWLSSVSARILQLIYTTLSHDGRASTKFRVEELVPFRDETRYQFQVASRRQSVNQLDWEMVRGQPT